MYVCNCYTEILLPRGLIYNPTATIMPCLDDFNYSNLEMTRTRRR